VECKSLKTVSIALYIWNCGMWHAYFVISYILKC
jgi:hypothetical protein